MPKSSSSKKRSAFDSVANLELEDEAAAKLRKKQSTRDVARAKAARSQNKIYGHLMESRILLQRSLPANSDPNEELVEQCDHLLEQLLTARRKLMPLEEPSQDNNPDVVQSEYQTCQQSWKDVLNRRHQDLRLHAGLAAKNQFKVLDSSFWQQVESTVAHEEMRQRSADTEEFDDAKVYQQMLKEFLVANNSSAEASYSAPAYSRPHSQKKKQVDRKASKGRKIRYVEITKLANFTFPVSRAKTANNLDDDEWFQSLFGGKHQTNISATTITAMEEEE